jgi:hypothetical protein
MGVPIRGIPGSQISTLDDQQILRITFLGRFGEVERAGDDRIGIYDRDLVVGDCMLIIDQDWDSGMGEADLCLNHPKISP